MDLDSPDQSSVVEFLSDPATHGVAEPVEVITTHSAHVFLAGKLAYKIKRAVKYNYLDFTTLEARERVIRHELALNAPAAPAIYDRVVTITRDASGQLSLNGAGVPVEYALRMHRFAREDELTFIADAGNFSDALAESLGASIADFHAAAAKRPPDGAVLIGEIIEELREALGGMQQTLGRDRVTKFFEQTDRVFGGIAAFLSRRSVAGRVRRCHGDLHLKNLVMIDGKPVPFDALEFDERLGTCDVFYDFAFLVMDLLHRGLDAQANALLNSYLRSSGDFAGLAALPLFLSIRAAIRSMVAVQTTSGTVAQDIAGEAREYLEQALRYLSPSPPRLVAVGGLSGTGKTTIAARIAPRLGSAPGAVHLRSDLERKAMYGAEPLDQLSEEAYRPAVSRKVYARLLDAAEQVLRAGHSVIVDATYLLHADRVAIEALCARLQRPFDGIWLTADLATLERRVSMRTADASDADVAVMRGQIERGSEPTSWTEIDASGDVEEVVAGAIAKLSVTGPLA